MTAINKKEITLSDKIASILSTAPTSFDPEDDIYEETRAKVNENEVEECVDGDEEIVLSKFRKQNVDLLEDVDKKYVGKKGSRKSLQQDSDEWETEDEGLSTDEGEALDGISGTQDMTDSEENEDESEEEEEDNDEVEEQDIEEDESVEDEANFKHISETNVTAQAKKSKSVRNQLNMWENLLEMRIQLQKCLIVSNKMPQHDLFKNLKMVTDFKKSYTETKRNVENILEKFLTLQSLVLKQFPETKSILKQTKEETKQESDEEIPSDSNVESDDNESDTEEIPVKKRRRLTDYESEINNRYIKYKNYSESVIQKWNDKTRFSIQKNTNTNSILQHINFVLNDKNKLIKRTQLKRSNYEIIGKHFTDNVNDIKNNEEVQQLPEEYDCEIYDDDDFYHQLLRELIEFKSTDITDPVQMSRQWITLQNLRSKMKKRVDTKATKGRRIRYAVHSKLVNYMAPIEDGTWTDDAKNELYNSLFGNNK